MKIKYFFPAALAVAVALTACEGDKGDLGPAGPQGPQGSAGNNGTNGTNGANGSNSLTRTTPELKGTICPNGGTKIEVGVDANKNGVLDDGEVIAAQTKYVCNGEPGTANVYYSDWIVVDESKWVENDFKTYTGVETDRDGKPYPYIDTAITYHAEVPTPKVTQEILDKGVVYYYFKDMTTPSNGKIYPYTPWDEWTVGVTNHIQTGKVWEVPYSFYFESANDDEITKDKLMLKTSWYGSNRFYFSKSWTYDPVRIHYSELKPKTNFAIRYVVIPGGVTGKVAGVNFKSYEEVKRYLNIKD